MLLWLLINNKVLNRDNLATRRKVEDESFFCYVKESNQHLFFEWAVAKQC